LEIDRLKAELEEEKNNSIKDMVNSLCSCLGNKPFEDRIGKRETKFQKRLENQPIEIRVRTTETKFPKNKIIKS